jgi:hypothetical protein
MGSRLAHVAGRSDDDALAFSVDGHETVVVRGAGACGLCAYSQVLEWKAVSGEDVALYASLFASAWAIGYVTGLGVSAVRRFFEQAI